MNTLELGDRELSNNPYSENLDVEDESSPLTKKYKNFVSEKQLRINKK